MDAVSDAQVLAPPVKAPRRIAPLWHTLVLLVFLLLYSAAGAKSDHQALKYQGNVLQYTFMMALEWAVFGYVVWGLRLGGVVTIRDVIAGKWETIEDFLLDFAIAAIFWIVAITVLIGGAYALGMAKDSSQNLEEAKRLLGFLVPRTWIEVVLWFGVAATAGFCEEFIFRGYIQRQFTAISGQVFVGIIVSSMVFGLAHAYEGPQRMLLIFIYGLLFSVLAWLRKNLRPGMMAHAWHDALIGLLLRMLFK